MCKCALQHFQPDGLPHMAACPFQPPDGLLCIAVRQQHGDGSLYTAARCINGGAGFFPLHAGGIDDDVLGFLASLQEGDDTT